MQGMCNVAAKECLSSLSRIYLVNCSAFYMRHITWLTGLVVLSYVLFPFFSRKIKISSKSFENVRNSTLRRMHILILNIEHVQMPLTRFSGF